MKHIKQKHGTGCGVACIAMLGGITYEEAIKLVLPDRVKGMHYSTSLRQLKTALSTLGFTFKHLTEKRRITSLKKHAIVILTTEKHYTHAVVWDADKKWIRDPSFHVPFDPKTSYILRPPSKKRITYHQFFQSNFESAIVIK